MKPIKENPLPWFIAAVAALLFLCMALGVVASQARAPVGRLIFLVLAMQLPYGAALFFGWKLRHRQGAGWLVLGLSLACRLILVAAPATFSDDLFRYIWDGQVLGAGINPYRFSPDAVELEGLRGPFWEQINHRTLATIYPPAAQAVFWLVAAIAPHPTAFKLASALADTAVVYLVILLAGGALRRPAKTADRAKVGKACFFGLVYGLNPLACVETGMSGHLESFAVALMLLALYAAMRNGRVMASVFLGAAAAVKLVPVLLLPAVARRRLGPWLACPVILLAVYLPFVSAGTGTVDTLDTYARRWEGNGGLFTLVKSGIEGGICAVSGAEGREAMVHLTWMDPLAKRLEGSFFSLHKDGAVDPARPGAFTVGDISLATAKLLLGSGLVFIIFILWRRQVDGIASAVWIMGTLVLVTPVLHPWYLLWILPLAAVRAFWPFYVFAAAAPLAYLPLDRWWAFGLWELPTWVLWLENGLFFAAFAVYLRLYFRQNRLPSI